MGSILSGEAWACDDIAWVCSDIQVKRVSAASLITAAPLAITGADPLFDGPF